MVHPFSEKSIIRRTNLDKKLIMYSRLFYFLYIIRFFSLFLGVA